MWINIVYKRYTHTVPIEDLREHEVATLKCWCQPDVDEEFDHVIHNSADGREKFETGERKPS